MKLIVIGGTAAGLSAASKARRMDPAMEITVFEASGYVSYGACGLPYYVGGCIGQAEELISLTAEQLREERNIPTLIHHRVTRIDRAAKTVEVCDLESGRSFTQEYDRLVIATGARPIVPPLPGVEGGGVYTLRTVEDGICLRRKLTEGARHAVVIGGGFIGLELSEQLRLAESEVQVVEALPRLLPMLPERYAQMAQDTLAEHGVLLHTGLQAQEIVRSADGAVCGVRLSDGQTLAAELVVMAVGVRPASELAKECGLSVNAKGGIVVDAGQQTSDPDIWACGDCVEMRSSITGAPCYFPLGTTANKQGRVAGENAAGGHAEFHGVLGSQITKIFELFLSSTGLNLAQAESAGFPAAEVSITKGDNASYYPGGGLNHITLVFRKDNGRLLGAQAAGTSTIAGRVNLLATAITAGMTVQQLNELDLVYSPSVAPVYDPILIAAAQAVKRVRP